MAAAPLPRARLIALVVTAVVAASVIVGLAVLATDGGEPAGEDAAALRTTAPIDGRPSIVLPPVEGLPSDPEARVEWTRARVEKDASVDARLRYAAAQMGVDDVAGAQTTLRGLDDPRAAVARELLDYDPDAPAASVDALRAAANAAPTDPFARFSYALALIWSGQRAVGEEELRRVRDAEPESFYGTAADDLLHPAMAPGYPPFIAGSATTAGGLDALRRRAQAAPDDPQVQVAYAAALMNAGRRTEAVEAFDAALTVDPNLVEARVGRIVASFVKDAPEAAFGQMGPLVRDFPTDPSPRLHLALMLLWLRDPDGARAQFRQVAESSPDSRLGRVAGEFLRAL